MTVVPTSDIKTISFAQAPTLTKIFPVFRLTIASKIAIQTNESLKIQSKVAFVDKSNT